MKTSIFVIVLIVVVFMAGALVLNVIYRKNLEKKRTSSVVSGPFVTLPVSFSRENNPPSVSPKRVTCKPIVMDLQVSDDYPF